MKRKLKKSEEVKVTCVNKDCLIQWSDYVDCNWTETIVCLCFAQRRAFGKGLYYVGEIAIPHSQMEKLMVLFEKIKKERRKS